jgi:hypothetical protein
LLTKSASRTKGAGFLLKGCLKISKRKKMSITCDLCGGLGNQLFMIFTTIATAMEQGRTFWFKNRDCYPANTTRYPYWNSFFSRLQPYVKDQTYENNTVIIKEEYFDQLPVISESHFHIMLQGYYQRPRYFSKHFNDVCKLIGIDEMRKALSEKIKFTYKNTASLHFRLGDYKKYVNVHPIQTIDYYRAAITMLQSNRKINTIFYVYEDEDTDYVNRTIQTLQGEYKDIIFVSTKPFALSDWEEMLVMSLCDHHIIANSTFSWWGAFFNTKNDKMVIYPERWFGFQEDMRGRFPENWIKI